MEPNHVLALLFHFNSSVPQTDWGEPWSQWYRPPCMSFTVGLIGLSSRPLTWQDKTQWDTRGLHWERWGQMFSRCDWTGLYSSCAWGHLTPAGAIGPHVLPALKTEAPCLGSVLTQKRSNWSILGSHSTSASGPYLPIGWLESHSLVCISGSFLAGYLGLSLWTGNLLSDDNKSKHLPFIGVLWYARLCSEHFSCSWFT